MTNTKRIEDLAEIAWARINDEVYHLDSEITENERIYCVHIIADAIKEALSPPAVSDKELLAMAYDNEDLNGQAGVDGFQYGWRACEAALKERK